MLYNCHLNAHYCIMLYICKLLSGGCISATKLRHTGEISSYQLMELVVIWAALVKQVSAEYISTRSSVTIDEKKKKKKKKNRTIMN